MKEDEREPQTTAPIRFNDEYFQAPSLKMLDSVDLQNTYDKLNSILITISDQHKEFKIDCDFFISVWQVGRI